MASLLNALNTAGAKLPMALGLLLMDFVHHSPLLGGGARADAFERQVLPASLADGGFYATGGRAAADCAGAGAAAGSSAAPGGSGGTRRGVRGMAAAVWGELSMALSVGARLLTLGAIWLPALLSAPLLLGWGGQRGRSMWLALMTLSLEVSGAAWIKWGQVRERDSVKGGPPVLRVQAAGWGSRRRRDIEWTDACVRACVQGMGSLMPHAPAATRC
jgi:hypothetical protein